MRKHKIMTPDGTGYAVAVENPCTANEKKLVQLENGNIVTIKGEKNESSTVKE